MKLLFIVALAALIAVTTAYDEKDIEYGRIESCRGCSLNRLPEVKTFINEDAGKYERLEVKFIAGAAPELVLVAKKDVELERLPLSHLSRLECNQLLQDKGFEIIASLKSEL